MICLSYLEVFQSCSVKFENRKKFRRKVCPDSVADLTGICILSLFDADCIYYVLVENCKEKKWLPLGVLANQVRIY